MKIINIFLLLALTLTVTFSCSEESTTDSKDAVEQNTARPNVVLIMSDDAGWGDLSYYGNTNISTPNIDALARNGAMFEHFYVSPVCSPTRAALLTGRHSARLGVYGTSAGGERMNLGETTIAEVFRAAGYRTAAYGKWHNGMQPPYHPNARGFDDFYGFCSGHWGDYFSPPLEHNGELVRGSGFTTDDFTDHGLHFIEENRDRPFFLYLPYNTPHGPQQVPDKYWDEYKDRELKKQHKEPTKEDAVLTRSALAMVANIDDNVGRVTSKLRELELEDNTIVIYMSDNGPYGWRWNGGMRGNKGTTDEGGVRTAFFVQWKDSIPAGKNIEPIASAIDILPTLAGLAGVDAVTERPVDGKDLSPLLFEPAAQWPDRMVVNHWRGATSVRTERYRLDKEGRLYDLEKDPGQNTDVAADLPVLADSLRNYRADWLGTVASSEREERPFTVGHPGYAVTQLPARDASAHGKLERSNRYPNASFFSNWSSTGDYLSWDVEVLADGDFEVEIWYTCAEENLGATIQLAMGESSAMGKITEAHDPPTRGMENDRWPRIESYVKDFQPLALGTISLQKGKGELRLRALEIPGKEALDFSNLVLRRTAK